MCVEYFSSLLSKQTGLGVSIKFKLALIAAAVLSLAACQKAQEAASSAASAAQGTTRIHGRACRPMKTSSSSMRRG